MPASLEAIQNELQNIGKDIAEMKHAQKNIQTALEGQRDRLTRMEERDKHTSEALTRAFSKIDQQDARLQKVELEQPLNHLMRGLVRSLGMKIIGAILLAAAAPTSVQVYIAMRGDSSPRAVVNERTVVERSRTPVEEVKP